MSKSLEDRMFSVVVEFIEDLKIVFNEQQERMQLSAAVASISRINKKKLLEDISSQIIPHKEHINKKDTNGLRDIDLFSSFPVFKVQATHFIHRLLTEGFLDKDNEETVWKYFHVILSISEQYKKQK